MIDLLHGSDENCHLLTRSVGGAAEACRPKLGSSGQKSLYLE